MLKTILSVPGMSCDNCRDTIQQALGNLPGVQVTHFDMRQHRVSVTADQPVAADVYVRRLEEAGYDSAVIAEGGGATETGDPQELYGGEVPSEIRDLAVPGAPPRQAPLPPEASPQQLYGGADLTEMQELQATPAAPLPEEASPRQIYGADEGPEGISADVEAAVRRHGGGPPATDLQDQAEEEGLPWSRKSA